MPLTLEIEFESRWLTTVGTLNLTMGAAGFRTRSFHGPRLRLQKGKCNSTVRQTSKSVWRDWIAHLR